MLSIRLLPLLLLVLTTSSSLFASENKIRYPAHVTTEAQQQAWRVGWPQLHGPTANGVAPELGYQLIDRIADMRLVWKSEAFVPPQSHHGIRGGFATPVAADGRVYIYYTWPSNLPPDASQVSKEDARALDTGRRDRTDKSDKPGDDVVLCVDALTGKTLWQRVFEGQGETLLGSGKGGGHGTMCVKDGRAYAFGMAGWIYCLDAATGETIWAEHKHPEAHSPNCAPSVAENVLIYREGQTLFGYRADTGERIWSHGGVEKGTRSSAFTKVWQVGDRELFVHENICLDPKTGKVLWSIGDTRSGNRTAILGDIMVTGGANKESPGPRGWRISLQGAKQLWQYQPEGAEWVVKGFSSPTFHDGWAAVDMQAPRKGKDGKKDTLFALFHLETGKAVTLDGHYKAWKYQPISAEGRYLYTAGYNFWIARLDPEDLRVLSNTKVNFGACDVSPAYVCGVLYLRTHNHLACYDLRAQR